MISGSTKNENSGNLKSDDPDDQLINIINIKIPRRSIEEIRQ